MEANADSNGKAIWWLSAVMGQHNRYEGEVFEYQPLVGTGAAIVQLLPSAKAAANQEFDEDDVEIFGGDRNVLSTTEADDEPEADESHTDTSGAIRTDSAPKPVGPYPHARNSPKPSQTTPQQTRNESRFPRQSTESFQQTTPHPTTTTTASAQSATKPSTSKPTQPA